MEKAIKKYWPFFLLPTLAAFIIGFVWPFLWGIFLSFHKFTTISKTTFVGLDNYFKVFQDSTFVSAFWFTAKFTVVSTLLINVIAFAIALALTRGLKGTNIFRTVFFLPNLIGGIVLGYIWQILRRHSDQPGQASAFAGRAVRLLGSHHPDVLAADRLYDDHLHRGLAERARRSCWKPPPSTARPARQTLFKVKLPMVMPSITICTFLTLTNSLQAL